MDRSYLLLVLACAACASSPAPLAGSRDVAFPSTGLQLKGRLHVPEDATARRAAVLLVHGNGPQTGRSISARTMAIRSRA
jgi:poly(3-hydroxybutyrate) depolymerase